MGSSTRPSFPWTLSWLPRDVTATDTLSPSPSFRPALAAPPAPSGLARARLPLIVWLYLLAVAVPIGFYAGPILMTTLRAFLVVVIVPLAVRLFVGSFGRLVLTDVLFTLHLAWATAALVVNNPDQVVEQTGSVGMEFLGGYLVGRAYIRTPEAFAALCRALALIVCCTLPFAFYEAMTGRPPIIELIGALPGIVSVGVVNIDVRLGMERVQAVFAHPILYGLFCSVAFSLSFVALQDLTSPVRRYVISALVAVCGLLSLSSGALLAIALQIALITWAATFANVRGRWWLLVGLFALAYVAIALMSSRPPIRVFMSYATFSPHTAFWRGIIFEWGMKSVWAHPLFGIGLNDWVRPHFMPSSSVDNFWLLMAMRYGIPGFLLIMVGYVVALGRVMARDFEGDRALTLFRRAWAFTFLGLSFTLCTVHIWTNVYSFVFFMFGAGMWFIHAVPAAPGEPSGPAPRVSPAMARPSGPGRPVVPAAAHEQGARPAAAYSRFPAVRRRSPLGLPDQRP